MASKRSRHGIRHAGPKQTQPLPEGINALLCKIPTAGSHGRQHVPVIRVLEDLFAASLVCRWRNAARRTPTMCRIRLAIQRRSNSGPQHQATYRHIAHPSFSPDRGRKSQPALTPASPASESRIPRPTPTTEGLFVRTTLLPCAPGRRHRRHSPASPEGVRSPRLADRQQRAAARWLMRVGVLASIAAAANQVGFTTLLPSPAGID